MNKAKWITAEKDIGSVSPDFRKNFTIGKAIKKAKISASAVGMYNLFINGKRVGDKVFTPGYTSFNHRTQYQTYDVTSMLTKGETEISILAGKGWAVGYFGYRKTNNNYADHISVIAWLDVTYEDGGRDTYITDESWNVYSSSILDSEIYLGEINDKTAEIKYICKAKIDNTVKTRLVTQVGESISEHERVFPVSCFTSPKGERIIDFGQNMTGYVEIKAHGKKGDKIVFDHAEIIDNEGNFYTKNMRFAKNEITYVLSGNEDIFKPLFSFQGFRYIRLKEYPFEKIELDSFTAIAVYSDIKRTGYFSCGNEKINQLYHNVLWGQRSNYLDIPTDCPQRDERLGWTGDAQVFSRTAALNFDVKRFFRKWLGDMALEQAKDGAVPKIIPNLSIFGISVSAAWADAACIIPWQIYLAYGDKAMLSENYPMMEKWVGYIRSAGRYEYLWLDRWHYGDWLAKDDEDADRLGTAHDYGSTDRDLIASAFYAYSTELLIKAGTALGKDMSEYEALYVNIKKAFIENFTCDGLPCKSKIVSLRNEKNSEEQPIIKDITQTSLVLMIYFKLFDSEEGKKKLVRKLAEMIYDNGNRLATGFVGTPYLLHVLSDNGYTDLAYTLLMQDKMPSWLFAVNHGATTIWERWDSVLDDGTFNSPSMTSFNHYAYGAVADWLYGDVAGISCISDGAGYRHILLKPQPDRRLGFVNCKIKTAHGEVVSNWYYGNGCIHYEFSVPCGSEAELELPDGTKKKLKEGDYIFASEIK